MARTIRTCSLALLAAWATTGQAAERPGALGLYVQARIADAQRMPELAAGHYAAALALDPANERIAWHAYREAITAGDEALALRAARTLETAGLLPADGQLLLYIAALRAGEHDAALARLARTEATPGLGFLAPLLREWLALDMPSAAPPTRDARANAYAGESRALLALAWGDHATGVAGVRSLWSSDAYRSASLRIAAAATLARTKRGSDGAALLAGHDNASQQMRTLALRGDDAGLAVDTPLKGAAFLLARVSGDLTVEGSGRVALTIARLACFADPGNARLALNLAGALAAARRNEAALAAATALVAHPVYGDDAASFRIEQLEALGRFDDAAREASARAARSPNDRARVGDIEAKRGDFAAAADAYLAVLHAAANAPPSPAVLRASAHALERAGRWREARPLYERLLATAPNDAPARAALAMGLAEHDGDIAAAARMVDVPALAGTADALTLGRIGRVRYRSGDFQEAVALLEVASRGAIDDAELGDWLGDAYWALGRRMEARYAWRAAEQHADAMRRGVLARKIDRGLP